MSDSASRPRRRRAVPRSCQPPQPLPRLEPVRPPHPVHGCQATLTERSPTHERGQIARANCPCALMSTEPGGAHGAHHRPAPRHRAGRRGPTPAARQRAEQRAERRPPAARAAPPPPTCPPRRRDDPTARHARARQRDQPVDRRRERHAVERRPERDQLGMQRLAHPVRRDDGERHRRGRSAAAAPALRSSSGAAPCPHSETCAATIRHPAGEPHPRLALPALDRPVGVAEQRGDDGRPVVDRDHPRVRTAADQAGRTGAPPATPRSRTRPAAGRPRRTARSARSSQNSSVSTATSPATRARSYRSNAARTDATTSGRSSATSVAVLSRACAKCPGNAFRARPRRAVTPVAGPRRVDRRDGGGLVGSAAAVVGSWSRARRPPARPSRRVTKANPSSTIPANA